MLAFPACPGMIRAVIARMRLAALAATLGDHAIEKLLGDFDQHQIRSRGANKI